MPVTTITAAGTYDKGVAVSQWSADVAKEYIKEEEYAPWSGQKPGAVFRYKEDLGKKPGVDCTFVLIGKLSQDPVEDDNTLEGLEEALGNWADTVTIHQYRHAVIAGHYEQQKPTFNISEEARYALKERAMEVLRDHKTARLQSPHLDGTTTYALTAEVDKDAWLAANSDRVLFGALKSNNAANDHSAALANVDTVADTLNRGIVSVAKRMAESCDPLIRPVKVQGVRQHFVMFAGTWAHRDLKTDLDTIHASAAPRENGMNNPIFQDDDLVYEDVIIRKVPSIATIGNVGAAAAPVYACFLCGASAALVLWGEHLHAIRNGPEGRDYGNQKGVGIAEIRGVKKAFWDDIQHGLVTVYVAAEADA